MDLYKVWKQLPKYTKTYACSLTLNSVHVCTCQYKMFRGVIVYGTLCIRYMEDRFDRLTVILKQTFCRSWPTGSVHQPDLQLNRIGCRCTAALTRDSQF